MRVRRARFFTAVVAAALGLSACVPLLPAGLGQGGMPGRGNLPDDVNTVDVMFVEMMIPHHEQAIEISDLLLEASERTAGVLDADLIALATAIKAAQAPEIEPMESWLDEWGLPSMSGMGGMDHGGPGGMGGMMSDAEMDALAEAEGPEVSRLFLELMIEHHEGAIIMAERLLEGGQNAEVLSLGESIISAQQAEIAVMRELRG